MGRRNKKSTGSTKSVGGVKFKETQPDPESREFYQDEVDKFHTDREQATTGDQGRDVRKKNEFINDEVEVSSDHMVSEDETVNAGDIGSDLGGFIVPDNESDNRSKIGSTRLIGGPLNFSNLKIPNESEKVGAGRLMRLGRMGTGTRKAGWVGRHPLSFQLNFPSLAANLPSLLHNRSNSNPSSPTPSGERCGGDNTTPCGLADREMITKKVKLASVGSGKKKQKTRRGEHSSDEDEVLDVRVVSSDDEDGRLDFEDEEEMDSSDIDDHSKNKDYLPSAEAWGKKRKAFYSTDYVGDDYGGLSGSDVETAQIEEEEALRLQKKHQAQLREEDFMLDDDEDDNAKEKVSKAAQDDEKVSSSVAPASVASTDMEKLSSEERLQFLKNNSPELEALLSEFEEKKAVLESRLEPILTLVKTGKLTANSGLDRLQTKLEIYGNYLVNLSFYFYLQATVGITRSGVTSLRTHPVIDRIMQWKKLVNEIETDTRYLEPQLDVLLTELKKNSDLSHLLVCPPTKATPSVEFGKPKRKKTENSEIVPNDDDEYSEVSDDIGMDEEEEGKRGITYEMQKNKGLTPHRKKEQRNPRVKHRRKFKQALIRKRSQVPDVRSETTKYGGETRGIRTGVVKSVKLK